MRRGTPRSLHQRLPLRSHEMAGAAEFEVGGLRFKRYVGEQM